jgi:hypothetical protein
VNPTQIIAKVLLLYVSNLTNPKKKKLFLRVEAFYQIQKICFSAPLYASTNYKNYSHLINSNTIRLSEKNFGL